MLPSLNLLPLKNNEGQNSVLLEEGEDRTLPETTLGFFVGLNLLAGRFRLADSR